MRAVEHKLASPQRALRLGHLLILTLDYRCVPRNTPQALLGINSRNMILQIEKLFQNSRCGAESCRNEDMSRDDTLLPRADDVCFSLHKTGIIALRL